MRPSGNQAVEAYMRFRAKEKGLGYETSKERKTVYKKLGRADVYYDTQRQWDTEKDLLSRLC